MQLKRTPSVGDETRLRFPAHCPDCFGYLGGLLIRQEFLAAQHIVELVGPVLSLRSARQWMRAGWIQTYKFPGRRDRLVSARDFVSAFEQQKRHAGRARSPSALTRIRVGETTECPNCGVALGGFVARLELLSLSNVVAVLGDSVSADQIGDWIRRGLLRGFKVAGVRGLVIEANDFLADIDALKMQYGTMPALGHVGRFGSNR